MRLRSDMSREVAADQPERRRTVWFWLIILWIAYNCVGGVVGVVMYLTGLRPMGYDSPILGIFHTLNLASIAFQCVGGVALFYFRPVSIWLLLGAAVVAVSDQVVVLFDPASRDFIARTTQDKIGIKAEYLTWVSMVVGSLNTILPFIYAVVLRRRNWLR